MRRNEPPGFGLPPSARGPGLSTREAVNCRGVTSREDRSTRLRQRARFLPVTQPVTRVNFTRRLKK